MSRPRLKSAKLIWHPVTNALVMAFADKDCQLCKGTGELEVRGEKRVCTARCFAPAFNAEYDGRLRRLKDGRVQWREAALASVPEDA